MLRDMEESVLEFIALVVAKFWIDCKFLEFLTF